MWIMNSIASKYMTLFRAAFEMYEVISPRKIHLVDVNVLNAIRLGSIIVEANVRLNINKIHINNVW